MTAETVAGGGGSTGFAFRTDSVTDRTLDELDAWWRAANYLSIGQIYLLDNPLLREPLAPAHIKSRLLGHWGTTPGLNFVYAHLNRVIRDRDLHTIFIAGPGHGGPGMVANTYLDGTYSEIYDDIDHTTDGVRKLFRQFSFPGGIPSHVAPETPGSIHEGGELGYSLSHAYGAVFDNPDLLVAAVVGDGEAETGPLATSWHSNKFIDPLHESNDRHARGERLHRGETEALFRRDEAQHGGPRHERRHVAIGKRAEDGRLDPELDRAPLEFPAVGAVVEESLPTPEDETQFRPPAPQRRESLEQIERTLARLDPAQSEHVVPQVGAPARAQRFSGRPRSIRETFGVDAVRDHGGRVPVLGLDFGGDGTRDADAGRRSMDGEFVTLDESRCGERVEVMDGPDALTARRDHRVRRDAVLRVHHIGAAREVPCHGADRALDALTDAFALTRLEGNDANAHRRVDLSEEGRVGPAAESPHLDVVAAGGESLRQGQSVNDAAARLGRVRDLGDLHGAVSR